MRTIYKKELARIFKDKKMVFSVFLLPVLIMVGIMALVAILPAVRWKTSKTMSPLYT